MKRIGVIRLSALGDIIHTIPAVALLKKSFPEVEIVWFVAPAGKKLLENFIIADHIVPVDLNAGLNQVFKRVWQLCAQWRKELSKVFDFQGLYKSAILSRLLSSQNIGFDHKTVREKGAAFFYKQRISVPPEAVHIIDINLSLLTALGITGHEYLFPLKMLQPSMQLETFLQKNFGQIRPVVLNVGGGWSTKRLTREQLYLLVEHLQGRLPLLLLWGNSAEEVIAREVARRFPVVVSTFFNFSELIVLLQRSAMLISGDTLALHLADLLRVPLVAFFGPTDPRRNGPRFSKQIIFFNQLDCSFCYRRKCAKIECMLSLKIEEMAERIMQFYDESA